MSAPAGLEHKDLSSVMRVPARLEFKAAAVLEPSLAGDHTMPRPLPGAPVREVTAVVAVTGVRDNVGDTIMPGAFRRTLSERPKPKVCLGHDWNRPIGKTREIKEFLPGDPGLPRETFDGKPWPTHAGALIATFVPDETKDGTDAYNSAKFYGKSEDTYSIGYRTAKFRPDPEAKRFLDDLDLFEYGPVLIPAHPLATQQSYKAGDSRDVEIKASQVRDTAYWGMPYGTPITAHMSPHGPKAREERRAGRVPSRNVGTIDSASPGKQPMGPVKVNPADRAAELAGTGLFPEPASDKRVLPHPTRARGKDQDHVDALAGEIAAGNADPDVEAADRTAIDKAVRGLLDEAITPSEVRERLTSHPSIEAAGEQRNHQEGEPGSYDADIDRVATDYSARYAALAHDQQRNAPEPVPAARFTGMSNAQLAAHHAASTQILGDLEGAGTPASSPAHQVATSNVTGAQAEMNTRRDALLAHPTVTKAHATGLTLHQRNSQDAAARAQEMAPMLAELQQHQQATPARRGGRSERMPYQIQAMIHGLNGRNADGSEREQDSTSLDNSASIDKVSEPAPAATPRRTLADYSDADLETERKKQSGIAFRAGNFGTTGDKARVRIKKIEAIQGARADASRRSVPAHPMSEQDYRAASDKALDARFRQDDMRRENEQIDKQNAQIDIAEQVAASAPQAITSTPDGTEAVAGGRMLLANPHSANWSLRTADNKRFLQASDIARPDGKKAKLNRAKIESLAQALAGIQDGKGSPAPFTAPDSTTWSAGFRDEEGHSIQGSIAKALQNWTAGQNLSVHESSTFAREPIPRGRPVRTDVADTGGFYPNQHLAMASPGDEIRLPDGSRKTLHHAQKESVGSGYVDKRDRQFQTTMHFTDNTSHAFDPYSRHIDIRYADGRSPMDPTHLQDPGMGFTTGSGMGMRLEDMQPREARERREALAGTLEPGTRILDTRHADEPGAGYDDTRPKVGRVTNRVSHVEGTTARVVEYDDGTFDAVTPAGLRKLNATPTGSEINQARSAWNLPSEGEAPEAARSDAELGAELHALTADHPSGSDDQRRRVAISNELDRRGVNPLSLDPLPDEQQTEYDQRRGGGESHTAALGAVTASRIEKVAAPLAATGSRARTTFFARDPAGEVHSINSKRAVTHARFVGGPTRDENDQPLGGYLATWHGSEDQAVNGSGQAAEWNRYERHVTPVHRDEESARLAAGPTQVRAQGGAKLTPGTAAPTSESSGPASDATAAVHANALARMTDKQAQARLDALAPGKLAEIDSEFARRATELGSPGVRTRRHEMVHDAAQRAALSPAPSEPAVSAPVIEQPALVTSEITPEDSDELATLRDVTLGLHEDDDGHLEVEPEVAARQDRVSSLLDQHQAGKLSLTEKSTDELHTHRHDLTEELRLQEELARRPGAPVGATASTKAPATRKAVADVPPVRPGLAGAAQDHAEALRSGDAEAIARTRTRLDSSVRRSRAGSTSARALADHVSTGGVDAENLDKLAGSLKNEARTRRNAASRSRRTAKRLDRERIRSVLGSVDSELRGRGESPEVAATPGAPQPNVPTPRITNATPTQITAVVPDKTGPAPLTDKEYSTYTRNVATTLDRELAAGRTTDVMHTHGGAGVAYTPQRAALHKDIVDSVWARNGAHIPREGRSILAGGLMGAGKSTVLGQHAGIDTSQYLTVDPDALKEEFIKRDMVPKVEGLTPMEAAPLVHEESGHVAKMLAKRAYQHRTNLIWDVSMSSKGSMDKRIQAMAEHGYARPDGVFVDIPVETSVERAAYRHRTGLEQFRTGNGIGGRYVPPDVIRQQAHPTKSSANREVFDQLADQFAAHVVFDNSVFGREPRKMEGTGQWGDSTSRVESATLGSVEKPTLTPNPAWKRPREAAATLTDDQRRELMDISHTARATYAKRRAAGHDHDPAMTLAKGQSLTDESVPQSRVSMRDSLESQAVAATGSVPMIHNAELAQALDGARQRLRNMRNTNLASEPTRGDAWRARVAPHQRRVAALAGLSSLHSTSGGTASLTDNPALMSPARLQAQVIALEDSTNPDDIKRLRALRRAAEKRGITLH